MNCEICGREIGGAAVSVKIEGSLMRTCRTCAKLGDRVYEKSPKHLIKSATTHQRTYSIRKEKVLDVVDDCARIVRENREKMSLTQDQLGQKINEKGSVISRIESGHMMPDIKIAKKLERFLGVTLLEELEE
jgi:putative transcription factor